jgi:hypothetical protein
LVLEWHTFTKSIKFYSFGRVLVAERFAVPKILTSNKARLYVAISRKKEDLHCYPSRERMREIRRMNKKELAAHLPKVLSKLPLIKKIRKN